MNDYFLYALLLAYTSFARAYAEKGQWQEVEALARAMTSEGLTMNDYFLYALLLAYACASPKQPQRAEDAFRDALAVGVPTNRHVLAALQRSVGRQRGVQLLQEVSPPLYYPKKR